MPLPSPHLILPAGTKVVTLVSIRVVGGASEAPAGSSAVIVEAPVDAGHLYLVRLPDGREARVRRTQVRILRHFQEAGLDREETLLADFGLLEQHVIFRCVVGSRAYGLDTEESDTDSRGIYLPPADLHWSLYGVPEQIENKATDECYWELGKFLRLALKANPNVLECLFTPIVEHATPIARELLSIRDRFLSRLTYQTYNGYTLSQFKKLEQDLRTKGRVKWKHVMHLVRLLRSGITVLREGRVLVEVGEHRDELLAIKSGSVPWEEIDRLRLALHAEFEQAYRETTLPERPDYETVNDFLLRARRTAL